MTNLTPTFIINDSALRPTIDVLDAAAYLNVSKFTVINRIKSGKLKAYKQGKHWKIKREWLLEYEHSLFT
ncbi:helix-turn-helix domain-containing protein [Paenibacillus sp. FSL H7-0714]|uniref:helix-turn-helix domain-containing protein n=1 Tax=Paenibacillus sp. FSL H7-0714 TaxID=2954735 RepID=UPI0030FA4B52